MKFGEYTLYAMNDLAMNLGGNGNIEVYKEG